LTSFPLIPCISSAGFTLCLRRPAATAFARGTATRSGLSGTRLPGEPGGVSAGSSRRPLPLDEGIVGQIPEGRLCPKAEGKQADNLVCPQTSHKAGLGAKPRPREEDVSIRQ